MKVVHPFLFLSEQDWYFSESELHCPFLLKYKTTRYFGVLNLKYAFLYDRNNSKKKVFK